MNLFGKDLTRDVAIIAEIGVNHEGSPDKAAELLELAAIAGADAVKFQSYTPERYASASDPVRLERVRRFALGESVHADLAAQAQKLGVSFFSTPLSEDWVPFLATLSDVIKIASGDLTFEPVVRTAARTGKAIVLSTGLGTIDEIEIAVGWVRDEVGDDALKSSLALMHCVSAYPVPVEEASVQSIPFLRDHFDLTIGYSNHVIGPLACWSAIALGAPLIEVHFTDCKTGREFRDHELSFEPNELRALVDAAPRIRASLGQSGKQRQACEEPLLEAVRKGVVAARDIPANTVLCPEDLMYARPATGIPALRISEAIGASASRDIKSGESLTFDDICGN